MSEDKQDYYESTEQRLDAVRRARVALLRNPLALAEIRKDIQAMPPDAARVLRKMLADDLRLMRRLDRQHATGTNGAANP